MYMMLGFQKELRRPNSPAQETTEALYLMLQEQGVHRVEIYDGSQLLHGIGTAVHALSLNGFETMTPPAPVRVQFIGDDLVHARVDLPHRRGPRAGMGMGRRANRFGPSSRTVLLELVPKEAIVLRERAFQIMILDMVAAIILMGAAIIFWRLSVRQDALRMQLEKDQQLKMLGQMSAVLGHELKNTIASVKGHSQLLEEELLGSAHESRARLIVSDSIYLQNLTEQMLAFARSGALNREKVYIDDLAEAATTFSEAPNVTVQIDGKEATFHLDRQKMQQVLVNLLNNAHQSKATDITLSLLAHDQGLQIRVTDNGPGMDDAHLEKIFDPFYTTRAKGTGLGLALAKRVVEAHGGTLSVRSTVGAGTAFTIELPPTSKEARP